MHPGTMVLQILLKLLFFSEFVSAPLILLLSQHLSVVFDVVFESGLVAVEHRVQEAHSLLLFVLYAGSVHVGVL